MFGKKKVDGIIEAVHFDTNGLAEWFRIFERRGPTWSDRVKLSRGDFDCPHPGRKKVCYRKTYPIPSH